VDFDKRGKQIGLLQVPHSVCDNAWGVIRVPIAVISNGSGPTVVLEDGNHGDEYEGPFVLGELVRTLDPGILSGRLIFIPAINLPAVAAAHRTSPLDDLNFKSGVSRRPSWLSNPTDCRVHGVTMSGTWKCPPSSFSEKRIGATSRNGEASVDGARPKIVADMEQKLVAPAHEALAFEDGASHRPSVLVVALAMVFH
jgi:hypothetical protein